MKKKLLLFVSIFFAALAVWAQSPLDSLDIVVDKVLAGEPVDNIETTVENDTCRHNVLIFGDSTLDGVARRFADYARQNGYTMYSSVWYGATLKCWAYTTELPRLIKKVKPTFIIISLGTNDLGYHDIAARGEAVREIMREIGDIPFIWIGPISLKSVARDPGIVNVIRENVGADRFYDSYHLKLQRFPDGIHPTFEASGHWVDGVARWMSGPEARHPIVMEYPRTTAQQFKHDERHQTRYKGTNKNTGKTNTLR